MLDLLRELVLPRLNTAGRLDALQPSEEGLVLDGDLDQFFSAPLAIQALLVPENGIVRRLVQRRLGRLHDVGHLLEEDSVFALDLSIAFCA